MHRNKEPEPAEAEMERHLLEYEHLRSRYWSRSDAKIRQRALEQMFQEQEMDYLIRRLERIQGSLEGARILEIGSGAGTRAVAAAMRGARVVGIDPCEAGVVASRLRARRYPHLKVHFLIGVGEHLPFPDGSFDLVFSTEVLHLVEDVDATVAETSRVLRRGGHCYHEAPNNLYPREFHYRVFWIPFLPKPLGKLYARLRGKDPRHLDDARFLHPRLVAALLRRHGFGEVKDLYFEEVSAKALDDDAIRSPAKRRVYGLARRLGLAGVLLEAARILGVYPQLRVRATRVG